MIYLEEEILLRSIQAEDDNISKIYTEAIQRIIDTTNEKDICIALEDVLKEITML